MTGYIYKITNLINGKIYIGKTTSSIEERWKEHIHSINRDNIKNRPLYKAINKYGIKNFSIEKIEEVQADILSEREIYWINFYDSFKTGYNATLGGDGAILYDYSKIEQALKDGKTTTKICEEIGCCKDVVHKVSKQSGIPLNMPITTNSLHEEMMKSQIAVNQYDKQGNFIQSFVSYAEAARWLQSNGYVKGNLSGVRSKIGEVCRGIRKSAYKFIWKFSDVL